MPKRSPKAKGGRKTAPTSRPERHMVRKNFYVDQSKLDLAKASLGTDTETETVDRALDRIIFAAELSAGIEALAAAGGLEYFESGGEMIADAKARRRAK
jgi:hypothetical protein